jgi:hypothetical protein
VVRSSGWFSGVSPCRPQGALRSSFTSARSAAAHPLAQAHLEGAKPRPGQTTLVRGAGHDSPAEPFLEAMLAAGEKAALSAPPVRPPSERRPPVLSPTRFAADRDSASCGSAPTCHRVTRVSDLSELTVAVRIGVMAGVETSMFAIGRGREGSQRVSRGRLIW